jgi:hypothetical protein
MRVLVEVCVVDGGVWIRRAVTNRYTGWNSWTNWVTLWDSGFAPSRRASSTSRIPPGRPAGGGTAENCARESVDIYLQLCDTTQRRADASASSPSNLSESS